MPCVPEIVDLRLDLRHGTRGTRPRKLFRRYQAIAHFYSDLATY
jgi:hypothetical protein